MRFWQGMILGFSVAAPVGPIGLLCIRRSLRQGSAHGFVTGLGAASADAAYGMIAAFGLRFVASFLVAQQNWLRLCGGIFLIYLAGKIFFHKNTESTLGAEESSLWKSYFSALFLTITNPLTILSFSAAFAALGLASSAGNYFSALSLVSGVFLGSAIWWLILSFVAGKLRSKVTDKTMLWINRFCGALLFAFGLTAIFS